MSSGIDRRDFLKAGAAAAAMLHHHIDGIEAIGEVMGQNRRRHHNAGLMTGLERQPDAQSVQQGMQRKSACAQHAPRRIGSQ